MDHRNGKWAGQLLALQNEDGTWGSTFHTLTAADRGRTVTTEQALRRLKALGFTLEDAPIRRAVDTMTACLRGERKIDDYWEKGFDWALFTRMMLSTWVRIFDPENETALLLARQWGEVLRRAFASGRYEDAAYRAAYGEIFYGAPPGRKNPGGKRVIGFTNFYLVHLLQGVLPEETEDRLLEHLLDEPGGIYYVCGGPIRRLPPTFQSRETVRYLDALEMLSGYRLAAGKLAFAADWLRENRGEDGQWDLSPAAKDRVHLPLSDSWRKAADRRADCTEWIGKLLSALESGERKKGQIS